MREMPEIMVCRIFIFGNPVLVLYIPYSIYSVPYAIYYVLFWGPMQGMVGLFGLPFLCWLQLFGGTLAGILYMTNAARQALSRGPVSFSIEAVQNPKSA